MSNEDKSRQFNLGGKFMWRKALIIGMALILAIGVGSAWYLKSRSFMATAASVLSTEATKALETEVKIGQMRLRSLTGVTADSVTVYDKTGTILVAAESVDVNFSPLGMINGKPVLEAIRHVTVKNPVVSLAKRSDGIWNYTDLISKDQKTSNDFKGDVAIENGTATLAANGKNIVLDQINGHLDFVSQPAIAFAVSLAHQSATADLSGNWGGAHQAVSVKAKDFDLEHYLEFLPEDMAVRLKKGALKSVDATVLQENGEYRFNGEAVVVGVGVEVEGTDIEQIDGLLLFNEKELRIFSRALVNEQPIVLRGTTSLDLTEPILNLQVNSKGFDASKVLKNFPLQGKIAFQANIGGLFSRPIVEGTFNMENVQFDAYTMRDVHAKLRFADDLLWVDEARAMAFGGTVSAHGQIDAKSEAYNLQVEMDGASIAELPETVKGLRGFIQADLAISGQGTDFSQAFIFGNAAIVDGVYQGVDFRKASSGFYREGDRMILDYLTVDLPQGEISAEGSLQGGTLKMNVRGMDIDLAQAAKADARLILSGLADFEGQVEGTLEQPVLKADFRARKGAAFYQPYQNAEGRITATEREVRLEQFNLTNGVTKHQASGSIGLAGNYPLHLKLVSTQARAENLIRLVLPGERLTGNLSNTMTITGTLDDINVDGQVEFSDGSFRGILLKNASGAYRRQNGQTTLQDFVVSSPNLNISLNGVLKPNEDMDFDIIADDIKVQNLRLNLPYPAVGTAKFTGKLQGSVNSPIFNGILTADQLTFNGQALKAVDGSILYKDNVLEVTSFGFKQGDGSYDLSAGINLDTEKLYGSLTVKQGELGAILALVNLKNDWIGGKLEGTVKLGGTVSMPKVKLVGSMGEGQLKKYPLKNIAMDISLDGKLVTIGQFRAEQGDGLLIAKGKMDLAGPLDIEVAGQNIDAGLITHLADFQADTKGVLNFGAQISGTANEPQANLSVDIQGGGAGSATFDSLFGLFTLDHGIIRVNQLLAQKGDYKASAYGIIPLAAIQKSEKENANLTEQMDLKISLDQADLSILPFLSKDVEWAIGPTKGGVTIGGTLAKPHINGEILVKDGAIKFDALGKPVRSMALNIQFTGDRVELKTFEGKMGDGDYQMTGAGRITGAGLADYQFVLDLNKLEVANKYYTGPLQGRIVLNTDKLGRSIVPKLAGNLNFENCTIDIPPIPASEEAMPRIKLDLDVTVGKKVRLYNSFLYDIWMEGHVNFGGSTRRPQTSGEIFATRGTVSYLKTPFKIREATAYFNQVNSFLPSLNLEADTRLDRAKVYLKVTGPVDTMTINLTSDSSMNEAEILSLLTLRSRYHDKNGGSGVGRDELVALLDIGLQMSFLSEVEDALRGALGVDEFKVVRDTLASSGGGRASNLDREVYNIEIGKYLNDHLMLRYTTGVDHDSYKFGVQYDFNSRISLRTDIDQDNNPSIGLEARFKF